MLGRSRNRFYHRGVQSTVFGNVLDLQFTEFGKLSDTITHSRAGNATMVDSDGLIKWAPHNFATYSEDFSDSDWVKTNSSITLNAIISPNGTLNGSKFYEDSTTNFHRVEQQNISLVSGTAYTISIYAKAAERSWIILSGQSYGIASAWFNLTAGTVGTVSGTASGKTA